MKAVVLVLHTPSNLHGYLLRTKLGLCVWNEFMGRQWQCKGWVWDSCCFMVFDGVLYCLFIPIAGLVVECSRERQLVVLFGDSKRLPFVVPNPYRTD